MKKQITKINCGDWHLGWGYGGQDKIGKLELLPDGTFYWEGYSQGRHGGTWNEGAMCTFKYNPESIVCIEILSHKGSFPELSQLINGAETLLNEAKKWSESSITKA